MKHTWGALLKELVELQADFGQRQAAGEVTPDEPTSHDILRRKYLGHLSEYTGRATIWYASAFLENKPAGIEVQISLQDMQGLMEAVSNVEERELDLILHSPGGSAEAAESIVEYLRTRFDHIRVIVPIAAMSAATMLALSADEIVMGAHSQLGPIDPQFTITTPEGPRSSPGQAILDQFEMAQGQVSGNPNSIGAWLPILRSYSPGLLAQCISARELAEKFVSDWLRRFMFKGDADANEKADRIAEWFSNYSRFKSHGRRVSRDEARDLGLRIVDLEADDELQDRILAVHHSIQHTLSGTALVKGIENHHGRAWMLLQQVMTMAGPPPSFMPPGQTPNPPPQSRPPSGDAQPMSRAERRRQKLGRG